MDLRELAETVQAAFEAGDFNTVASYLADDFVADGPGFEQPASAQEWLGGAIALKAGFPDLSWNFQIEGVEGNIVRSSTQITGTHTNDLDLSPMGLGVIPATGKSVSRPRQTNEVVIEGGILKSIYIHGESGFVGILADIGAQPPG